MIWYLRINVICLWDIISSPLSLAYKLDTLDKWSLTRNLIGATATLTWSFFGCSPWLHGYHIYNVYSAVWQDSIRVDFYFKFYLSKVIWYVHIANCTLIYPQKFVLFIILVMEKEGTKLRCHKHRNKTWLIITYTQWRDLWKGSKHI